MTSRVGIFGGSFDPPHVGHLALGVWARTELGLDLVLVTVAHDPWQKSHRLLTPSPHRLRMVELAVDGVAGLQASDMELRRGGPSYTLQTVRNVCERYGVAEPVLILGSDAAAGLDTWHGADELKGLATIAMAGRGAQGGQPPPGWRWERFEVPRIDVSSSSLRDRLRAGLPVDGVVPPSVVAYITEHGLYS